MIYGITGHQDRPGIDWDWVRSAIEVELQTDKGTIVGLSSLAAGADQVFAQAVIDHGSELIAVIPKVGYEQHFNGAALEAFHKLKRQSSVVNLHADSDEEAFLNAGLYIAREAEILIAVWDGKPSKGKGGTADIVEFIQSQRKPWIHINPIDETSQRFE